MKMKKSLIMGLLIAVVTLGVGYAAISKNLVVSGTGTMGPDPNEFKVKFTGEPTTTPDSGVTLTAGVSSDLAATITVSGMTKAGQKATAVYTIQNDSDDLKAALSIPTGNIEVSNSTYFQVDATLGKSLLAAKGTGTADTTTLTVVVTALRTPTEEQTTNITVTVKADAQANT